MNLAAILQLISAAAPTVANLILMIKNANGSTSVIVTLNGADAQLETNQEQIQAWFAAHGLTPPVAAGVVPIAQPAAPKA